MTDLRRRMARLEATTGEVANAAVGAVDRPPRETREQWISRRAGELGIPPAALGATGEPCPASGINIYGETFGEWVARRHTELGISTRQEHQP